MATDGIIGIRGGGRLRGERRFSETYHKGRTWANQFLVLKALSQGGEESHWGFAVAKRLGSAVERNKLRRRLREIARRVFIRSGWDIVVVTREEAMRAEFNQLEAAFKALLDRAGLLVKA